MQQRFVAAYLILGSLAIGAFPITATAAVVDCAALKNKQCHGEFKAKGGSHVDEYLDPKDVQQCILRGFDAPLGCRKDEGKSAGVRVEGSSGFSYGAVQAPENSPGKLGSGASVTTNSIVMNLGFDWSGCKIFGINLCNNGGNDPNNPGGNNLSPPAPLVMKGLCPEKNDPNQRLGQRNTLSTAGLSLACGGTVPLTNYEVTMNANPTYLAVTEYKSYEMRVYQKVNGKYSLNPDYWEEFTVMDPPGPLGILIEDKPYPEIQIGPEDNGFLGLKKKDPMVIHHLMTFRVPKRSPTGAIPLPGYLCGVEMIPNPLLNPPRLVPIELKTTELTPTIAQMITYNKQDSINLRLMSRNTIKPVIIKRPAITIYTPRPWNPRHTTTIPPVVVPVYPPWWFGLPEHLIYFWPEPPEYDSEAAEEAAEKFLMLPIWQGRPVVPVRQEDPFAMAPVCGLESKFFGKPGKMSGDILLEQPTTLCEGSDEECAAMKQACEQAGGDDCDTITNKPANDLSCETTKLPLKYPEVPQACDGKMQWVVLDRHNMVYPPGTNTTPVEVDGMTSLMMPTVHGSRIFAQKDSNIRLGPDAPQIVLDEGGTLMLSNGGRVKMLPPATIDVVQFNRKTTASEINLDGGGMLMDKSGRLLQTYPKGHHLLAPDPVLPYIINLNRSFRVPPSYEYPSAAKHDEGDQKDVMPYVKLPLDAAPQPEVNPGEPGKLPASQLPRPVYPLTDPTPVPEIKRLPSTRGPR